MFKAFGAGELAHEVAADDAHTDLGAGPAFETFARAGLVLQSLGEFGDVTRTVAAAEVGLPEEVFIGFTVQSPVSSNVADR